MIPTETEVTPLWRPGPAEAGRDAVLEAAADQFVKFGFTATSMDGIADALGSTKGRVYHYYRGKAEIFLDVVLRGMADLLAGLEPIAAQQSATPTERLGAMVRNHALCMMEESNAQRVAVQLVQYRGMPELAAHHETTDRIIALRHEYENRFVEVLEEGIAAGDFGEVDPSLATKSLLGSLNWIPMWFRHDVSSPEDVARIAAVFQEMTLRSVAVKGV